MLVSFKSSISTSSANPAVLKGKAIKGLIETAGQEIQQSKDFKPETKGDFVKAMNILAKHLSKMPEEFKKIGGGHHH